MKSVWIILKSKLNWQRVPAGSIEFKALDREIAWLLVYAILYVAAGYGIGLLILQHPVPILGALDFVQDVWYSIVFKIVLLLLIPAFVFFVLWGYKFKDLILGCRLRVLSALISIALGLFMNMRHIKQIQENINAFPDAPLRLALGILMPLFVAAIPEEFFFRGYLQTRLEKKWNRFWAILVSGILFTAWHLPSRYLLSHGVEGQAGNLSQILLHTGLPVLIVGLLLGIHWSRYRNMAVLVLFHWAVDILPSISSYLKIQI